MRRPSLAHRVAPYGRAKVRGAVPVVDLRPWREVVGPLCRTAGERIAALFGISEDAGARLERLGRPLDATAFRVRQVGWATLALVAGTFGAATLRPPPAAALFIVFGAPLLTFLLIEQQLSAASAA